MSCTSVSCLCARDHRRVCMRRVVSCSFLLVLQTCSPGSDAPWVAKVAVVEPGSSSGRGNRMKAKAPVRQDKPAGPVCLSDASGKTCQSAACPTGDAATSALAERSRATRCSNLWLRPDTLKRGPRHSPSPTTLYQHGLAAGKVKTNPENKYEQITLWVVYGVDPAHFRVT